MTMMTIKNGRNEDDYVNEVDVRFKVDNVSLHIDRAKGYFKVEKRKDTS